jgi:hypothetical protein
MRIAVPISRVTSTTRAAMIVERRDRKFIIDL